MIVVYADELFLENFLIDYILLRLTSGLTGISAKSWRMLAASVFGSCYALAATLTRLTFLADAPFKLTVGVLMALFAFGADDRFARICLVYFALSAAFAGAVLAIQLLRSGSVWGFSTDRVRVTDILAAFGICYGVFSVVFGKIARHRVNRDLTWLTISYRGRTVTFTALIDTGNSLRDPLTGESITVCGLNTLKPLFDSRELSVLENVSDPAEALEKLGRPFQIVPCRTVSGGGFMLAFPPDEVVRDGRRGKGGLVAITRENLETADGFAALTL